MTSVAPQVDESAEALARRVESTARHWRSVNGLLDRRSDLEGVCPMADLIYEAVRWAA